MAAFMQISGTALREVASAQVFEKIVQDILHVNGKGVDESYVNGQLDRASISIPKVALGAGDFRQLGATVNGGQFNSNAAVISSSDYIEVPLLFVYDRTETLAKIMNDKAGYALLEAKTENIRRKIARGINALTFATQFAANLNADAYAVGNGTAADTLNIVMASTPKPLDAIIDANAKLSEGDEDIGCDYFPTENRQAFVRPGFRGSLLKADAKVILNSDLGQQMLATGVLNPWKNSEASKIEMRNGYCGEIDGVPMYEVSPILWRLAASYLMAGSSKLAQTAFDKVEALYCSSVGTIRGFTASDAIEVVPAQAGQGWVLQPLVHGGCVCVSGKSVRLICDNGFTNPVSYSKSSGTYTGKLTVLPPESQSA